MKPPFSYYGGKQRMASKIIPYIPKHTVYVEPFCGSATLLFKKPWPDVNNTGHYREYINDKNELIVNFFRQLATNGEKLADYLSVVLYSECEYQKAKEVCKNPEKYGDFEKAVYFFINIQQSFSNKFNSGWGRGVFSRNLQATWEKARNLYPYIERMGSVGVTCQDALTIIKQYDSPQTFFYCDPPYPGTGQGHYSGYSQDDFNALIFSLESSKASAIVSCYNQDDIFDPLIWTKAEFIAHCSSSGKGQIGADRSRKASSEELGDRKRIECIYIKQADNPRGEIQKLYDSGKFDCFEGKLGKPLSLDAEAKKRRNDYLFSQIIGPVT